MITKKDYVRALMAITGIENSFFLDVLPVFRKPVLNCLLCGLSQDDTIILCFTLYCEWKSNVSMRMNLGDFEDIVAFFLRNILPFPKIDLKDFEAKRIISLH
jgi:hypothetical protein